MKLEQIGFYTLTDERAKNISGTSQMKRCEIIITEKCNFKCPYCRGLRSDCSGVKSLEDVKTVIDIWTQDNLENIRFSGGEPTTHKNLLQMVEYAKLKGIKRIAISTNGSSSEAYYRKLVAAGANDFSISLDSCCSAGCDAMAGVCGFFDKIISNIKMLAKLTYVTLGVVITDDNIDKLVETVSFAHTLGVADIRVISAAQYNKLLEGIKLIPQEILDAYPVFKYRADNISGGRHVRGLRQCDSPKCHLVKDDSAVAGNYHFPCIIYLREQGDPIGKVGPNMRAERIKWFKTHNSHNDPICSKNCLDVCIDFNNKCEFGIMNEKQNVS